MASKSEADIFNEAMKIEPLGSSRDALIRSDQKAISDWALSRTNYSPQIVIDREFKIFVIFK